MSRFRAYNVNVRICRHNLLLRRQEFVLFKFHISYREVLAYLRHKTRCAIFARSKKITHQLLLTSLNFHLLVPYGWNPLLSLFSLSQLQALVCGPLIDCMPTMYLTQRAYTQGIKNILFTKERARVTYLPTPWNDASGITSICHNKLGVSY